MNFTGRDIISIKDFSRSELDYIINVSEKIAPTFEKRSKSLDNKIMATLFFEPSTRTKLSFESAMFRLGGMALGFQSPKGTSVEKGENLADTIRTVMQYADVLVIRHPLEGAARLASQFSNIPVINAGSGSEEHPTQAMLDLFTIHKEYGGIDRLNIGLVGDLRYGRTTHSLAYALSQYDVKLYLISPDLLRMRKEVIEIVRKKIQVEETDDLNKMLPNLDVVYMTRIQKERFVEPDEYEKVKSFFRLTTEDMKKAKDHTIVMHPLPRVDEISPTLDRTKHATYFKQVRYGVLLRMALLSLIFGVVK
ncbi:aspartate carbamoyltransferase [[Eubacterium] cellulosolvens]